MRPLAPALADAYSEVVDPVRVRRDVLLAPFTTFRIGGPADLFYGARSVDELARAVGAARGCPSPW
ncbi:MAG: UDP-N-acetylenolpyruvoylglucosamine reductase, partial [Gemmatimonadetes bacterium]|nr:UDP-N-acetylenolpyruvoylglucosamine reductase [Gemmatimonadota bacterium]